MIDISFDDINRCFHCFSNDAKEEYQFEYKQEYSNGIDCERYIIQLLINPFLNRESNVFKLQAGRGSIGYIFPISVLDSDNNWEDNYSGIHRYIYAAYKILLQRLPKAKSPNIFSDNFEDNICVYIVDKIRYEGDCSLHKCIHTLRQWGYSYFENDNKIARIPYFNVKSYIHTKRINLDFKLPSLYNHDMIDYLLREYPKTSSPVHRFIILYQVIEFLFAIEAKREAATIIEKYKSGLLAYNDFATDLRALTSEKNKIAEENENY